MRQLVWIFLILLQQQGGLGEDADSGPSGDNSALDATIHGSSGLVKRSTKDPFSRRSALDKNFIRFGRSGRYFHDESPERNQKNLMSFARVSRAARDNFMRFERPEDEQLEEIYALPGKDKIDELKRLIRGKDNFMRFGRAKDSFMRFGRGKDDFMRFGRGKDNFMRFGRAKDNFMRFGRGKDNFMRFGRLNGDKDLNAADFYDSPKKLATALKNESGFLRFGRSEPEADTEDQKIDDDDVEVESGGLDLQADKPKNGPIIRIKRDTQPATLWDVENDRSRRDVEVMDQIGIDSESDLQKRYVDLESYFQPQPQDWIVPDEYLIPEYLYYSHPEGYFSQHKRRNGGSNFIRFG